MAGIESNHGGILNNNDHDGIEPERIHPKE